MLHKLQRRSDEGFTLIELLIVIIVLGILVAIVLFGLGTFKSDSQTAACKADVKQLKTAETAYIAKHPGGSADAAATLRLLCARDGIDPNEEAVRMLAARLGADVPACLVSQPVRGEKRGDSLIPLDGVPSGQPLLLVNPMRPLATGPVFAHWDGVDRGPLDDGDPIEAARKGRNDLEPPAIAILPVIGEILTLLAAQEGVLLARMSGSGATCFALFDDEASLEAAADGIAEQHSDWWLMRTRLR